MRSTTFLSVTALIHAMAMALQNNSIGHDNKPLFVQQMPYCLFVECGDGHEGPMYIATMSNTTIISRDAYYLHSDMIGSMQQHREGFFAGKQLVGSFEYFMHTDSISVLGLEAQNLSLAVALANDSDTQGPDWMHFLGIIGLGRSSDSNSEGDVMQKLCDQGQLDQCRFGIAFNVSDTSFPGTFIVGTLDQDLIKSKRTTTGVCETSGWTMKGDVIYEINGKQHTFKNQRLIPASEVYNVIGPMEKVKEIFNGMNATPVPTGNNDARNQMLYGNYPCENDAPKVGFSFGSKDGNLTNQYVWPFDDWAWKGMAKSETTCTAPVVGWEGIEDDTWYLGQTWLRGKYLDFDLDHKAVTVAEANVED